MKLLSIRISAFVFLVLVTCNLMAQDVGIPDAIDVFNASYDAILQYIILFATMVWGQVAKLFPAIKKDTTLPKVVYIVLGAAAVVILIAYQGVGSIPANLMSILAALGAFDLLKGVGNSTKTPEDKAKKLIAKAVNLVPEERVQEIARSLRA